MTNYFGWFFVVQVTAVVKKWGNSLGVIIDNSVSKKLDLKEGEKISLDILPKKRFSGFGILKTRERFEREHDERDYS